MNLSALKQQVEQHLKALYQGDALVAAIQLFSQLVDHYATIPMGAPAKPTENNIYLIVYGDSIYEENHAPLNTLKKFLDDQLHEIISDVHILPMFPYTSDDGFSVVDYLQINPDLGDWADIEGLSSNYRLMFDFVANHMSKSSMQFQKYLNKEAGFDQAFIEENEAFDTSKVVRPRTSPLFHHYKNQNGETRSAWTTFSEDQVDLNAKDPKTLCDLTEILLTYAHKGASSIRLDAIGFLWKESGTSCMSLPQTHEIIKLWASLLQYFAPHTQIITETNVPHQENISYFGNGNDEAHQVYQFTLPPLALYSFTVHSASKLTQWAKSIHKISDTCTYFNFLASHDGIGLRPIEGILNEDEKSLLVEKTIQNNGFVSYKKNVDGSQSVYELNINYGEALRNPGESDDIAIQKIVAAHHILFSMIGIPAVYYHSILGSRNDVDAVHESGISRRINRKKLNFPDIMAQLTTDPFRNSVFTQISKLLAIRKKESAFDPYGEQEILEIDERIFALKRMNPKTGRIVYCYTNVSAEEVMIPIAKGLDLLTQTPTGDMCALPPYGFAWVGVASKDLNV